MSKGKFGEPFSVTDVDICKDFIYDNNGNHFACCFGDNREANARWAIECMNVFEGIDDPEAELARLREERDEANENLRIQEKLSREARKVSASCIVEKYSANDQIQTLTRALEKAEAALKKHGMHYKCPAWQGKHDEHEICTCGYSEARAAIRAEGSGGDEG